jgi:rhodanese-related sulfurtransferase
MNYRKHFLEAATLIVAAVLCAVVSNALASRERKVQLVGNYPNARTVPVTQTTAPPPPVITTTTTTTVAPAPAPAPLPAPVPTTTTAPPTPATRVPQPATPPPDPLAKFQPHEKIPYVEIAYDDAAKLHAAGVLFLDARRTSVYEEGHIAGARPFSVWESDIDDKVNKLFAERGNDPRDQAKPIVVYCSGGECEDSHMLAQKLWGIQFNNVYVYKDGFPDWQKHGGAVHTGTAP